MSSKLGDFGFSYEIPQHKLGRTFVTAPSLARTEGYYAPEVAHGQISPKADIYSWLVSRTWVNPLLTFMQFGVGYFGVFQWAETVLGKKRR